MPVRRITNPIRPVAVASLLGKGEARVQHTAMGGWGQNGMKVWQRETRRPVVEVTAAGVRTRMVARKCRNGHGAKAGRKAEA